MIIAVLTCPRPGGVSYIDPLLERVELELPAVRRVLVCHGPAVARRGWEAVVVPRGPARVPDNKGVGWTALTLAARAGESMLFLEDDVRPVPGGLLAAALWQPVAAWTSFWHPDRALGTHVTRGFERSQAILFPAPSLPLLVDFPQAVPGEWDAIVGFDLALGVAGSRHRLRFEQGPRLFEHVGVVSAASAR